MGAVLGCSCSLILIEGVGLLGKAAGTRVKREALTAAFESTDERGPIPGDGITRDSSEDWDEEDESKATPNSPQSLPEAEGAKEEDKAGSRGGRFVEGVGYEKLGIVVVARLSGLALTLSSLVVPLPPATLGSGPVEARPVEEDPI